jgi:hypothetical protein
MSYKISAENDTLAWTVNNMQKCGHGPIGVLFQLPGETVENMRNVSYDSQRSTWESNQASTEHKSKVSLLHCICLLQSNK